MRIILGLRQKYKIIGSLPEQNLPGISKKKITMWLMDSPDQHSKPNIIHGERSQKIVYGNQKASKYP